MFETICAIISIVYMLVAVAFTAHSLSTKDKRLLCTRIKNYKKGKFMAMYAAAFPLYLAAYQSKGVLLMIFSACNATVKMAVWAFDTDALNVISDTNALFSIAVTAALALTVANTMLLSVSVFFREMSNRHRLKRIAAGERDVVVFIGFGHKNKSVLLSMKRDSLEPTETSEEVLDVLVLTEDVTGEFKEEMYINASAYMKLGGADVEKLINEKCGHYDKRRIRVIIETEDSEKNLRFAYQMASLAHSLGDVVASAYAERSTGLDTYVFTDGERDSVYRRIIRRSRGTVHSLNIYTMIARDFITEHPITAYIPKMIDTDRAILKAGAEIRVVLMGFGRVNRKLFYSLAQNNQLLGEFDDEKTKEKKIDAADIKYFIFDKKDAGKSSDFNHNYERYSRWLEESRDTSDYLELPALPANFKMEKLDSNDRDYFSKMKGALSPSENAYNMIVIAVGEDMHVLDISEMLTEAVREAGCENNTSIFVRLTSRALANEASERYDGEVPLIPFGAVEDFYTYDRIINPGVDGIAKDRHLCYALEDPRENETEADTKLRATKQWLFEWEEVQRESNVYACLALRTKLNLLGYDLVKGDPNTEADDSAAFLADYGKNNEIKTTDRVILNKNIVDYEDRSYRVSGSVRTSLAIMEHMRWNAYYVSAGFVPASKTEHTTIPKASRMRKRIHINLTTPKGLDEYERWCEFDLGEPKKYSDIWKYDYQLMDDAVWLAHRSGNLIKKIKVGE